MHNGVAGPVALCPLPNGHVRAETTPRRGCFGSLPLCPCLQAPNHKSEFLGGYSGPHQALLAVRGLTSRASE